jgi:hypothetical protein
MSARQLWLATFVVAVICWCMLVVAYLAVSQQVHSTQGDVRSTYDLFGLPLVEGFRAGGRLGLKFGWADALSRLHHSCSAWWCRWFRSRSTRLRVRPPLATRRPEQHRLAECGQKVVILWKTAAVVVDRFTTSVRTLACPCSFE